MSKRHTARLIKKQRDVYADLLRSSNYSPNSEINNENDEFVSTSGLPENNCEVKDCEENVAKETLSDKLVKWYIKNKISRNSFEELLTILRDENLDLPKRAETLMPKIIEKPVIRNVSPGLYCHLGIRNQIQKICCVFNSLDKIVMDVNIDGLPLFKSSRVQLWPILIRIVNCQTVCVLPVGIYVGVKKPNCIVSYLEEFVSEMKDIKENGVLVAEHHLSVEIRAVVCDAPAKAFICGVPGHVSFHGCTKCTQVGKKIANVLTYSTEAGELITDDDFEIRKYKNHHTNNFKDNKTPLENLGIKMISQVSIDSMHLLDLGVMRKFLLRILQGKVMVKVTKSNKTCMSKKLELLRKSIPEEFVRKPRSFEDIAHWKATEFRQFLLYTGIVVFRDELTDDAYYVFLLLHCACRLLLCPKSYMNNIETSKQLLELFVHNFPLIFGASSVSYNIHNLLHLADSIKTIGIMSGSSAYDFENYLQTMKKYVKKPTNILQQIFKKVQYETVLVDDKKEEFKFIKNKGLCFYFNNCLYTSKKPDNICCIKPYIPIVIQGFVEENNEKFVLGRRLTNINSFFKEPTDSMTIGICCADDTPLAEVEKFSVIDIDFKFMSIPYAASVVLVPILHSCL